MATDTDLWFRPLPVSGSREAEPVCGHPLGLRVGLNQTLFVADAYLGLFEIHPTTGR